MKPLTRYWPYAERHEAGAWNAVMREHRTGGWYAKGEADARIAELERYVESYQSLVGELEAERDAARADAERNRVNAERYEWLRLQNNRERGAEILTRRMNVDAAIDAARGKE